MGRTILISPGESVLMSTIAYLQIIEKIREQFLPEEQRFMEEIYRAHDHEGQEFIALWEQRPEGVNAFCRAARAAYEAEVRAGEVTLKVAWEELLETLRADRRWTRPNPSGDRPAS